MATTEFSESTFGFALTHNIVEGMPGINGLPAFPNTRVEGQAGGGYDVLVPRRISPLYLQFKVPQVLLKRSHLAPPGFPTPYYRVHLRTREPANQHRMLREHAQRGELVFYAAPRFHTSVELNRYYATRRVLQHTAFFRPSDVGPLDQDHHFIAYHQAGAQDWWVFSEPSNREVDFSLEPFVGTVREALRRVEPRPPLVVLREVLASLSNLTGLEPPVAAARLEPGGDDQGQFSTLVRACGEMAQQALGAQLVFLTREEDAAAV